jgi:hypothetical protein
MSAYWFDSNIDPLVNVLRDLSLQEEARPFLRMIGESGEDAAEWAKAVEERI